MSCRPHAGHIHYLPTLPLTLKALGDFAWRSFVEAHNSPTVIEHEQRMQGAIDRGLSALRINATSLAVTRARPVLLGPVRTQ